MNEPNPLIGESRCGVCRAVLREARSKWHREFAEHVCDDCIEPLVSATESLARAGMVGIWHGPFCGRSVG